MAKVTKIVASAVVDPINKDIFEEISKHLPINDLIKNRRVSKFWKTNSENVISKKLSDTNTSLAETKALAKYAIVEKTNDAFEHYYRSELPNLTTTEYCEYLELAILADNEKIKELLISTIMNIMDENCKDLNFKETTPLHLLIQKNDLKHLTLALQNHFYTETSYFSKKLGASITPLRYAIENSNIEAIYQLLRFGAKITAPKYLASPLELAKKQKNPKIIAILECEELIRKTEAIEKNNGRKRFFEKSNKNIIKESYKKAAKLDPNHFLCYVAEECNRDRSTFSSQKIKLLNKLAVKFEVRPEESPSNLNNLKKSPTQ